MRKAHAKNVNVSPNVFLNTLGMYKTNVVKCYPLVIFYNKFYYVIGSFITKSLSINGLLKKYFHILLKMFNIQIF
jgi:hypothetical protein